MRKRSLGQGLIYVTKLLLHPSFYLRLSLVQRFLSTHFAHKIAIDSSTKRVLDDAVLRNARTIVAIAILEGFQQDGKPGIFLIQLGVLQRAAADGRTIMEDPFFLNSRAGDPFNGSLQISGEN